VNLTFQYFFSSSILWQRNISESFSAPPLTLGRRKKLWRRRRKKRRKKKRKIQRRKTLLVPPNVPATNPLAPMSEPMVRAQPRRPRPLHPLACSALILR
jgi:hypothetical protein